MAEARGEFGNLRKGSIRLWKPLPENICEKTYENNNYKP
jgi:hypothetical protein